MTIQCYWLEPNGKARRSLRRYRGLRDGESCSSPMGYHDAGFAIDEVTATLVACDGEPERQVWKFSGDDGDDAKALAQFAGDPRWPTACVCGYVFTEADARQIFTDVLYARRDTGAVVTLDEAPAGAMYDASWIGSYRGSKIPKPDNISLTVKTPGGTWFVDGVSSNGPGWTRSGDVKSLPPTVTATPSILISGAKPEYHGWLRSGQLVDA